ncbi:MAG: helix-turn-helix domain-containing protein [Roseivivax sp.]|nr:helix-turn-helix domain-containing protein [Roseivivax sp.]
MTDAYFGPDAATFGDRLTAARDAAGLTQDALARQIGIKTKTLKAWENDVAEPRANRLQMLAGMLNVSIVWLLTGEGDGLEAPADAPDNNADMIALLGEIREIRTQMKEQTDRLARVEKRLRTALKETAE